MRIELWPLILMLQPRRYVLLLKDIVKLNLKSLLWVVIMIVEHLFSSKLGHEYDMSSEVGPLTSSSLSQSLFCPLHKHRLVEL